MRVLNYALKLAKGKDILNACLGLTNHTKKVKHYIDPLLVWGLLDRTIKSRPNCHLQHYITAEKGWEQLRFQQKQSVGPKKGFAVTASITQRDLTETIKEGITCERGECLHSCS